MERLRYHVGVSVLLALSWAASVSAQSVVPPQPPTLPTCDSLSGDQAPAEVDSPVSVKRLLDCGYELNTQNEYRRAQAIFERAGQMAGRLPDRKALASALAGSGMVSRALGQADRAEPLLRQSLQISEEMHDKDGMAFALSQLGRVRSMQARYEEARAYHARSFELSNEIGDRQGAAVALNNVGAMYRAVGDYVTALEYYQRSLDALDELGDRRRSSTVLDNMGSIARQLGDSAQGLALTRRGLEIREALNDRLGVANSLDSLSAFHEAEGNYAEALAAMHKSLSIRQALGAAHGTAEALNNIAGIYQAQGDYAQAIGYITRALALNKQVGSESLLAEIHTHLGELLFLERRYAEAEQSLKRSLAISQPAGYKTQEADGLYALGRLYLEQGRTAAAADALGHCLEIREASRALRGRAETLVELGEVELRRRDYERGLARAMEAEQLARTMELSDVRWRALTTVGRLALAMRRPADARQAFDEAIAIVEDLRFNVAGGNESRSRFFANRLAPYQERIALAIADGRTEEAFYVAERSKARALLDVMRSDHLPLTGAMSEGERKQERALRTALSSLNSEIMNAAQSASRDEARVRTLERRRDAKRLEYEDFQAALYASHPELRVARAATPVIRAPEAARLLADRSEAIVEFVIGRQRIWAFAIEATGTQVFELAVSTADLEADVERFRRQLAARDLRSPETARQLYERVFGPMRAVLSGKTDLTIVPDGVLWELPFQALQSSANRYVVEDMAISYAPSVTVLSEMSRVRKSARTAPRLLAFGNPTLGTEASERRRTVLMDGRLEPLPEAEVQVNSVGEFYGASSRVYIGADAHEERWKAEAGRYAIVHLATHGVMDDRSPLYSHVVLAAPGKESREDGLIEAWEIMNLQLDADLVVLSACETARGRVSAGEGVIGLMWAFFVAGSPSTLVTQWKVESASSTELMVAFHTEWNAGRNGLTKARALQRASLRLLRSGHYAHPFYWAGYVLVGDRR